MSFEGGVGKSSVKFPTERTDNLRRNGPKKVALKLGKRACQLRLSAGAVGHNAVSIMIPCHRVVGANGSLTGYAGGIDKKFSF